MKISKLFDFQYNLKEEPFKRLVEKALVEAYEKFFSVFGFKVNDILTVKIFSSREDYKDWTGYGDRYRNWMVGRCDASKNEIGVIIPTVAERPENEMIMIVKHEAYHYLLEKCFGDIKNIVLNEGMACFLADQIVDNSIDLKDIVSIKKLNGPDFADLDGYTLAPIYISYIIRNFGYKKFVEIVNDENFYLQFPKDFERIAIDQHNNTLIK